MSSHDLEKTSPSPKGQSHDGLTPQESVHEADLAEYNDDRNGQFHRSFTPRQVHIISLGSNIGSGVFIGTGSALANGGPGNMIIAYSIVCSCVWAVLQTLSEMTIAFPTSGNFIDYAGRWVDPALAFGAGFAEWLGWTAIIAAEAVFCDILINFWAGGKVPPAAIYTLFLAATFIIFCLPNTIFAWFEYVTSIIKIFLFLIIIFLSLALVLGAGPNGKVADGSTWTDLPPFKNGFSGFSSAALLAVWAVGDQVFIGIMGGEAQSPRHAMGHATKLVPYRVGIVYMLSVMFITLLVRSDDERLLGGGGVTASPFVIATIDANIPVIGDILNAGMIIGILAISAESVYLASRVVRTMAHQNLIPEFIARVDSKGRPRWALGLTCGVGTILTYINLAAGGRTAFTWLISITSASFFCNWIIISFTSWRFHVALKAQNDPLFEQTYAWSSVMWPLAPVWLMSVSLVLTASCFSLGINPLGGADFTPENFFQYIIGLLIIVVFTAAYKVIMRTPWRDPATADLKTGRRNLSTEELNELDAYYALPTWRRFGTYVQLW
ncbi:amino acid permease/ SLC12A domain-containing protein [Dactylonectria estremocensis]|uniref:Amino acid permease/ SLC12A domain-containing protein n=1 Tax=Dactylonectria estremocensis TaxID=1079267 RepID=A0A9P9EBU4_9HYPO|nr:amino acid permease/ SLC12A domain-containing protein [Dactylonectria estremocensis]